MLGKLPVPGRPTNLDYSRERAYRACGRCGGGCLDIFLSSILSLFFLPLLETARYRLEYCLKGPLNPKQTTKNQSLFFLPLLETARYRLEYCLKGPLNPKQTTKNQYRNVA